MHLVERAQCATESDYDTDDLIEDARNFVITGKRYSSYQRFLKNVTISFRAAGIYVIPNQLILTYYAISPANWWTCQTGPISMRRGGRGDKREKKKDERERRVIEAKL